MEWISQPALTRTSAAALERMLRVAPVVVVLGARQMGKTTLLKSFPPLADRPYLTLDDFDLRALAERDPEAVVARAPKLVLDEVQRARDLLVAVKRAVDEDPARTPGRFVLTGSANLLMMERIGESLAGRAAYVTLWPLTRREQRGEARAGLWTELLDTPWEGWRECLAAHPAPRESWQGAARRGGLPVPAVHLRTDEDREAWFSGYVQTYLERDLQALRAVENLADFRRLMRAAALRLGTVVNQTELGRDIGMPQSQVHRFLNVLEVSFQLVRLPAFSVNRTRRLIKTPKLYWSDPALALFLAGETEPRGPHLENLVLMDLLAWRETRLDRPEVLYWRTAAGHEVDFVIETPGRVLPIEVKASRRVATADVKGLETFLDEYPRLVDGGLLLYDGDEVFPVSRRVLAVPWWWVV